MISNKVQQVVLYLENFKRAHACVSYNLQVNKGLKSFTGVICVNFEDVKTGTLQVRGNFTAKTCLKVTEGICIKVANAIRERRRVLNRVIRQAKSEGKLGDKATYLLPGMELLGGNKLGDNVDLGKVLSIKEFSDARISSQ